MISILYHIIQMTMIESFQQYNLDSIDFKIALPENKTGIKYSLLKIQFSAEKENEIPCICIAEKP